MRDTHEVFEVVYQGVVYDVSIDRTKKVPVLKRPKRVKPHELVSIPTGICEDCGGVTLAGICMDTNCMSNSGKRDS